ncbi:MAG: peptide chain release factor N(5)-glutamine methyltransferase [Desulfobacterales bacterium]|nr:MAG: peptide chain release factor N(5)-glutamine methyltransferase [Desulfobacterales bacterium]
MQNQAKPKRPDWTILKLLQWTASYFRSHDIDSPRVTAEILLAHVLRVRRIDLYLRYDQPLTEDELTRFKAAIQRRIRREPVAYITGVKEFWSMDLAVTQDVLIPRPETECLVEETLRVMPVESSSPPGRIIELGTGSGAVILALASQSSQHDYFASDISIRAVELARSNAKRQGLLGKIHFFCGDWFSSLKSDRGLFDCIVSNPPYIRTRDIPRLQPEIYEYEPAGALDGDENGLSCLRAIIAEAYRHLKPGGWLLLEIGHDQKEVVEDLIRAGGHYDQVHCTQDYSGYDRVVRVRRRA